MAKIPEMELTSRAGLMTGVGIGVGFSRVFSRIDWAVAPALGFSVWDLLPV